MLSVGKDLDLISKPTTGAALWLLASTLVTRPALSLLAKKDGIISTYNSLHDREHQRRRTFKSPGYYQTSELQSRVFALCNNKPTGIVHALGQHSSSNFVLKEFTKLSTEALFAMEAAAKLSVQLASDS